MVVTIALASLAVADRIDRLRAERRFEDLRSFSNFVIQDLDKAVANGPLRRAKFVPPRHLQYLDSLAPEARGDKSLKLDLIGGYLKVAGIHGDLWHENVGNPPAARQSLHRAALVRLRPLVQRDKPSIYYLAPYIGILDDTPFAELTRRDDRVPAAQRYVEIVRDSESLDLLARALERDGRSAEAAKVEAEALAMPPPAKPGRPVPENRESVVVHTPLMKFEFSQPVTVSWESPGAVTESFITWPALRIVPGSQK